MKALRNSIGFALIVVIISGLGYIGWYLTKGDYISWSTIMGTKTASNAHNQHTEVQQTEPAVSTDVNPLDILQGKVTSSKKSIQQVAESMSTYPSSSIHSEQIQHFQRGVYALSEGDYLLNQLDQNLEEQARLTEASTPSYQVYANRHNLLVQNKTILSNIYQKLTDAKELFLSNSSSPGSEESVNIAAGDVQQANKAIYQMAQAIMELDSINQWVDNQIQYTMLQGQALQASEAMKMETATTTKPSGFTIGSLSMSNLITMFTILFIVLMLAGVIGVIRSQTVTQPQIAEEEQIVNFKEE